MTTPEPDRFGRAFLAAVVLEAVLIIAVLYLPRPPDTVAPATVQLRVLAPAPAPVAKPPPPKPPPPVAKPLPAPITPPMPVPTPPAPHHPVEHRIIHHFVHAPPPPPQPPPPTPEPPAPVTAAPPVSQLAEQTAMSRYTGEVRAIILGNLEVPQQLIDAGLEGDCVLEFTLAPDGSILSAAILTPSGLASVNDAALNALRASHLPEFLPGMPSAAHDFTLPVHVSGQDQ